MCKTSKVKTAIKNRIRNIATSCEEAALVRGPLYTACVADYENDFLSSPQKAEPSITERVNIIDSNIHAVLMEIGEQAAEGTLISMDLADFWDLSLIINRHACDIRRIIDATEPDNGNDFVEMPCATKAFKNYYYHR